MSNVTLHIGGRTYAVACAAGEEDHVSGLGKLIDDKLHSMGNIASQSETRQLLFAALLLADEVHESRHRGGAAAPAAPPFDSARLEALAERLENCASALEGQA
jgi:cell division protein ZapA